MISILWDFAYLFVASLALGMAFGLGIAFLLKLLRSRDSPQVQACRRFSGAAAFGFLSDVPHLAVCLECGVCQQRIAEFTWAVVGRHPACPHGPSIFRCSVPEARPQEVALIGLS